MVVIKMHYKLVIFGNKTTTKEIIEYVHHQLMNVSLVVTVKESHQYRISGYSNLTDLCNKLGIPIYYVENYQLTDQKDIDFFSSNTFDIGISTGWQRLIPKNILQRFNNGIFGFHGSAGHLPFGRGRSPLNWSIIKGHKRFINHCFQYSIDADAGKIHSTQTFEINDFDTIKSLQYKTIIVVKEQLRKLINDYMNNTLTLYDQSNAASSWYPKRTPEDGMISLKCSTEEMYNLIRAVTRPFPGAFLFDEKGEKIIIWVAYPFDRFIDNSRYNVGEVVEVFNQDFILNLVDGMLLVKDYDFSRAVEKGDIFFGR